MLRLRQEEVNDISILVDTFDFRLMDGRHEVVNVHVEKWSYRIHVEMVGVRKQQAENEGGAEMCVL